MCILFYSSFVCIFAYANVNFKTTIKQQNIKINTICVSAFEPGASWLPYYCTSICVRSWCNWRLLCGFKKKKKLCGSAFEPDRLPYYCTFICVRFGCTRRASCVNSKPKKKIVCLYIMMDVKRNKQFQKKRFNAYDPWQDTCETWIHKHTKNNIKNTMKYINKHMNRNS